MTDFGKPQIKQVIRDLLLPNTDYRPQIVGILNTEFLDSVLLFIKKVAKAKSEQKSIDADWYKDALMNESLAPKDIAINAGINVKTIVNIHGTERKDVVINAANQNYESMRDLIDNLIQSDEDINLTITIKVNDISVNLDIAESLVVINALAIKRLAMRGGIWSLVGKRVEVPLMLTLCHLYKVPSENYSATHENLNPHSDFTREIDFFLLPNNEDPEDIVKCEVKLMGKGNPESADGAIANNSKVFVADTLSDKTIKQLDCRKIHWVQLKSSDSEDSDSRDSDSENSDGYRRFATVLKKLKIPHTNYNGNIEKDIDKIIDRALK